MNEEKLKKLLGTDNYYQGVIHGIVDVFQKLTIIIGVFGFLFGIVMGFTLKICQK
jgi:hypothetical protein